MHSFSLPRVMAAVLITHTSLAQETEPEEVIVTSTALRESARDIAQPAAVLSGDALRRQIAASIGESITNQLGVSATYFGPAASRPVIRGLSGERVLVLQDGLSTLDVSSLSQDHGVAIESVLADQIEILKGPAALLFGSGAVGGVVNVVDGRIPTRFTRNADRAAIELRGDTAIEERTAVGRLETGSDHVRLHVDAFRRDTDDIEIPGFAFSAAERAEHLDGAPDEVFDRGVLHNADSETHGGAVGASIGGDQGFIGVSWSPFDTNYGAPGGHTHGGHDEEELPAAAADAAHDGVRIDMQQDRYDLKGERLIDWGPFSALRVRGAYNDYAHQEIEGEEIGTRFEQDAWELRVNLDHGDDVATGWRGTIGAQYVDIDFAAFGDEAFTPPSITEQFSVFTFQKRAFGALSLELGARVEQQQIDASAVDGRYHDAAFSASLGGVWRFADAYSLAAHLSRSERHPQAAELFADGPHLAIGRIEIGEPTLEKEVAQNIDLTLHRHAESGVHWALGVFFNDFTDYIYPGPVGETRDALPVYRYTQGDAEFYGFEAEVTLPLRATSANLFEVRLASDYVRGRLQDGGNLPQIPPLRYGVELHYERGAWHVGVETYRYDEQDRTAPTERPTAGYTMLDADASYRFALGAERSVLVFLRASNLLDDEARRHTSPLKEVAPLPGRSVLLGARAEFD